MPTYLTKGALRDKLLTRLGYGGIGAAAGMFVPVADDLLEEAQEQLFQILTDEKGVREWTLTTGVGQRWYDVPDTCDIDKVLSVAAIWNEDEWQELTRGINLSHDSDYEDLDDYPQRYDIRWNPVTEKTQIEVWPKPDGIYAMKIEGPMTLLPFVADGDRASFDSRLVLLYAVAHGKAHLNKPDARAAMDSWNVRLKAIRANQHGTRRYIRRSPNKPEPAVLSRPKVV